MPRLPVRVLRKSSSTSNAAAAAAATTAEEKKRQKKQHESSDDGDSFIDDDDDEDEWTDEDTEEDEEEDEDEEDEDEEEEEDEWLEDDGGAGELDKKEYRKFLAGLYPSRYANERAREAAAAKDEKQKEKAAPRGQRRSPIQTRSRGSSKAASSTALVVPSAANNKNSRRQRPPGRGAPIADEDDEEEEQEPAPKRRKHCADDDAAASRKRAPKRKRTPNPKDDDEASDIDLGSLDSETESETEKVPSSRRKKSVKAGANDQVNIIFHISDGLDVMEDDDEYDDDDWDSCDDDSEQSVTEDEDAPISDSETETDEEDEEEEEEDDASSRSSASSEAEKRKRTKKVAAAPAKRAAPQPAPKSQNSKKPDSAEMQGIEEVMDVLKALQQTSGGGAEQQRKQIAAECLQLCEANLAKTKRLMERRDKKERARNERILQRILRDKNTMNDRDFYRKMDTAHQKRVIKQLREINAVSRVEKPYRLTLIEMDIPAQYKAVALKKVRMLRDMDPGSGEYFKIKQWVDAFMQIPFGKYCELPVSFGAGGVDEPERQKACQEFMSNAYATLNKVAYGLEDAKAQIMQMLGLWMANPAAIGTAIALSGAPGTGKTSLVRDGISQILGRPFELIALGGATDSSFLEGHGYTYEGSIWGKIVQTLINCKCMNPVIFFDELDKVSDTAKGEEIIGILTHLTDTSQNAEFQDKYFSELKLDLSKCLFVFSFNTESKINPILLDRMYRIETTGYNVKQKTIIASQYLMPKICEQVRFGADQIMIPESVIHYIVENYCGKEQGVRNLKRCLETLFKKLNLCRFIPAGSELYAQLFEKGMPTIEFPLVVSRDLVERLIKRTGGLDPSLQHLYI